MNRIDVTCTLDTYDEKNGEIDPKSPKICIRSHRLWGNRVHLKVGSEEHIVLARDLIAAVKKTSD